MESKNSSERSVHLPIDIIIEILSRLPVKSLLKFRCVSKSWFSLISSPSSFINNNTYKILCKSTDSPNSLSSCSIYPKIDDNSSVETLPFDSPSENSWNLLEIVGSCNGLVCLSFYQHVTLWNPATRESRQLPHSGTDEPYVVYGFGYDATNDDYKVVEFSCNTFSRSAEFRVYSLRNDSWRILDLDFGFGMIYIGPGPPGVFVNGALHWIGENSNIVALNVTNETCKFINYPAFDLADSGSESEIMEVYLGVSGGPLLVSCNYETHMDVWVMKEYGVAESWTKLLRIPYYLDSWGFGTSIRPLSVLESGGILLGYHCGLVIIEPSSHYYLIDQFSDKKGVEAVIYRESLVSPNSYGGAASR